MNRITGELLATYGKLTALETLSLYNNEIEGEIPSSYYDLKSLKILFLRIN